VNRYLDRIVECILSAAQSCSHLLGIVTFGSYARSQSDYYSDLDLFIYCDADEFSSLVAKLVVDAIAKADGGILHEFKRKGKWFVFTRDHFVKVEFLVKSVSQIGVDDIVFIEQSRVQDITHAVVYDPQQVIAERYRQLLSLQVSQNPADAFLDLANGFVDYLNGFFVHYSRGDLFRAYMHYALCFFKIAGLLSLAHGETRNLYQPWNLTNQTITNLETVEKFYGASSTMQPLDLFYKKECLIKLFNETVEILSKRYGSANPFGKIIEAMREKYPPLYHFRDISCVVNFHCGDTIVVPKLLYRSASLTRYENETIHRILERTGIRNIIDLRGTESRKPYPADIETIVTPVPIPLEADAMTRYDGKRLYGLMLDRYQRQIGEVFHLITRDGFLPALIHCECGQYRTGIVVALLLDLLGLPRLIIAEDYSASFSSSDKPAREIRAMFETVDRVYGGSESYLTFYCGLDSLLISKIRNMFLNKDAHHELAECDRGLLRSGTLDYR